MAQSSIEWTEMTWNPTTGCDKLSAGCKFCYAEVMARRLHAMGVEKYKNRFELTVHYDELQTPYKWKKPKIVFVNSMSDLFHKNVPVSFIQQVFAVMNNNPQHIFQILTKRADLLAQYDNAGWINWSTNIWMGVSVENEKFSDRVDLLRGTKASIKFLSCELLLGPLPNLQLDGIDWVIVGGESGRTPRPMQEDWAISIKNQCQQARTAFFFKQWGGTNKKKTGRCLEGREYNEMPEAMTIHRSISSVDKTTSVSLQTSSAPLCI